MAIKNFLYVDANGDYTEGLANGNFVKRTCQVAAAVNDLVVESATETNGVDVITDNIDVRNVIGVIVEKPDALNALILNKGTISVTSVTKSQNVYLSGIGKFTDEQPNKGYIHILGTAVENNLIDFDPTNSKILAHSDPSGGIDEFTVLMVHSNTFDGGTSFRDSSDSMHTVTSVNGARHVTEDPVFGSSCIEGNGTSKLQIPTSDDFNFGTGDFTIDLWVKVLEPSVRQRILSNRYDNGWDLQLNSGRFYFYGGTVLIANEIVVADTWYHVAVVRESGTASIYINGLFVQSDSNFTISNSTEDLFVSGRPIFGDGGITGYIDELRISKGIARWTENFTPPTEPYTN